MSTLDTPAVSLPVDLQAWERLARAATPGNWHVAGWRDPADALKAVHVAVYTDIAPAPSRVRAVALCGVEGGTLDAQSRADAEFIAACSPERILGLIAAAQQGADDSEMLDALDGMEDVRLIARDEDGDESTLWWRMPTRLRQRGNTNSLDRPIRAAIRAARAPSPESSDHA